MAVSAIVRGAPNRARWCPIDRKCGRKSCPHSLIQWASSIASSETALAPSRDANFAMRSGATYNILSFPLVARSHTAFCSSWLWVLLRYAAGTPRLRMAPTWSCMSEMSGETTMVRSGQHQRRDLKAQGLATTSWKDGQTVPSGKRREDGLSLVGAETFVAPNGPYHGLGLPEPGPNYRFRLSHPPPCAPSAIQATTKRRRTEQ